MTIAVWTLSLLSIAEFTFAPLNLWTGRTMPNFTRFTGLPPRVATQVFAPVKLATGAALAGGLAVPARPRGRRPPGPLGSSGRARPADRRALQ